MMMWDYLVYSPGQIWSGTYMSPFFASQSLDHTSSFDTNAKFDLYSGSDLVGTYVLMDFWSGVPVTPREYRLVSRPFGYPLGRPTPIEGTTRATFTFDTSRSDPNPPVLSHFRIEQDGVRTDMPTGPASIRLQVADNGADWSQGQTDASDVRLEYRRNGTTTWKPLSLTKTGREYAAQIAKAGPIDLRVTARDASGNTTQEEWTPAFIGDMAVVPPPPPTIGSDFDWDGKPDLLWRNSSSGQIYIWTMDGVNRKGNRASVETVADRNWKIVGMADFNGDGNVDLLWRNYATGENYVWYINGTTRNGGTYLEAVPDLNWKMVGTGDFNGDGEADILWRNASTGENYVWYMNGVTRNGGAYLDRVADLTWKIVGAADFNGDGWPDLLWRNTSTGQAYIWTMNGVARSGYGADLGIVSDQAWKIVGTGDYNADGKVDIVWRNTSTGENYVRYMNGVTRNGGAYLQTVADQTWQIMPQIY